MEDSFAKKPPPLKPKPRIDKSRVGHPFNSSGEISDRPLRDRNVQAGWRPPRPPLPRDHSSQSVRRSQSCVHSRPSDSGRTSAAERGPVPVPRTRHRSETDTKMPAHTTKFTSAGFSRQQSIPSHSHSPHSNPGDPDIPPQLPPRRSSIQKRELPPLPVPSGSPTTSSCVAHTGALPPAQRQEPQVRRSSVPQRNSTATSMKSSSATLPRVATYRNSDATTTPGSKGQTHRRSGDQAATMQQAQFEAFGVVRHISFEQAGFKRPMEEAQATESMMDQYEPVNANRPYDEDEEDTGTYEPVRPYGEEDDDCDEKDPNYYTSMSDSDAAAVRPSFLGQPTPFLGRPTPFLGQPTPFLGQPTPFLGRPTPNPGRPTSVVGEPAPVLGKPAPVLGQRTSVLRQPTPALGNPTPVQRQPTVSTPPLSSSPPPPLPPRNPKSTRHQMPLPPIPSNSQPVLLKPPPPLEDELELKEEDDIDDQCIDMKDSTGAEDYVVPQADIPMRRAPSPSKRLPVESSTYELVDIKRPVPPPRRDSKLIFGNPAALLNLGSPQRSLSPSRKNQSPVGSTSYVMLERAAS